MNSLRILLLDFAAGAVLKDGLLQALDSAADLPTETQVIPFDAAPTEWQLTALLADDTAPVIFLLLGKRWPMDVLSLVRTIKSRRPELPLIVVAESETAEGMRSWLECGVDEFLLPPLKSQDLMARLQRLVEPRRRCETPLAAFAESSGAPQLIGKSAALQAVTAKLPAVAQCAAGVLLTGETGVGKELCARAIHNLGPRADGPFVPLNCGAIPVDLVENELFGHERGAFTDALHRQTGLLAEAAGGTLFLDEVDSLPAAAQVKMLRFLQDKEYRPLGAGKARTADVRLIAATNADPAAAVASGKLRQDLYYRLKIIHLHLPPLRDRREDIPLLARHFLARYATEFQRPVRDFTAAAMHSLVAHDWPGNVRELENLVASAVALAAGEWLAPGDLDLPIKPGAARSHSFREAKAQFEREYLETMLLLYHGNISRAALAARKNRRAFWEMMRKHCVDASRFRNAHALQSAE